MLSTSSCESTTASTVISKFTRLFLFVLLSFIATSSYAVAGSISGTVTDSAGQGIERVQIHVVRNFNGLTEEFFVRTDSAGEYTTAPNILGAGEYTLQFFADGFDSEFYDDVTERGQATVITLGEGEEKTANAQLAKIGVISGLVKDTAGNALENVRVESYYDDGGYWDLHSNALTDANGHYILNNMLPSLKWRIKFSKDGYGFEYYNDVTTIETADEIAVALAEEKVLDQVILTQPAGKISGKVTDSAGQPIEDVRVHAGNAGDSQTDNLGQYNIPNVPAGDYVLSFSKTGYQEEFYDDVTERGQATAITLGEDEEKTANAQLAKIGVISGLVKDTAGNALENVRVEAYYDDGGYWDLHSNALTDASGHYILNNMLPWLKWRIKFSKDGYGFEYYNNVTTIETAEDIAVALDEEKKEINAQLVKLGNIKGTIEYSKTLISGTTNATVYRKEGENWVFAKAVTIRSPSGPDDTVIPFDFGGLEENTYRLKISGTAVFNSIYGDEYYKDATSLVNATDIIITDGKEEIIDMVLGGTDKLPRGIIEGIVTDSNNTPLSNVHVYLFEKNASSDWTEEYDGYQLLKTDASGTYKFQGIDDGIYRLKFADFNGNGFEYYNNSATLLDADDIEVGRGDTHTKNISLGGTETGTINGTVTDKFGVPLENITISLSNTGGVVAATKSDSGGKYEITGLLPSTYNVHFSSFIDGAYTYESKSYGSPITIEAGDTIQNIDTQLLILGSIRGTVKDALGQAKPNIEVTLYESEDNSNWEVWGVTSTEGKIVTDSRGRFSFKGLWPTSGNQRYRLKFEDPDTGGIVEYYKDASTIESGIDVIVALDSVSLVNVVLGASDDQPESLDGIVKDANNNPLANVSVKAYQAINGDWTNVGVDDYVAETYTDSNGDYSFDGLLNGTYRIRFDYTAVAASRVRFTAKGGLSFARLAGSGVEYYKDATSLADASDVVVATGEVTKINDVVINAPDEPETPEVDVSVEATDATASEEGTDTGLFTITRTGSTDEPLVVRFNLNGTAEPGVDFQAIGYSVTIPAGAASTTIEIIPIDDGNTTEGDETVILELIDPVAEGTSAKSILVNRVVGPPATITIINNTNVQAIPTLQEWALILLIMLLLMVSWNSSKSQRIRSEF